MSLPDVKPACVVDGAPWYDFLFEYDWEGKTYAFDICARSEEEAMGRLKRLPLARLKGPGERVPVPINRFTLLFMPAYLSLVCWWRNRKTMAPTGARIGRNGKCEYPE